MATQLKTAINKALTALPTQDEIRRRIAENLQERQMLRQLLKLAEHRQQAAALTKEGRRE